MPRTARITSTSNYYHILSRGIGKQMIFEDDSDYLYFLHKLKKTLEEDDFDVIAYCLMENHFHLLLRISSGMDRIMKKICTSYAIYYNKKYERAGHLFQDRYKSVPIESEASLLNTVRYIHNNPVKAGICQADQYRWSSWNAYCKESNIVNTYTVLSMVGGLDGFIKYSSLYDPESTDNLEITDTGYLSDTKAKQIINMKFHLKTGTQIQKFDKDNRDHALFILKKEGLSIRQIERLTGISRGIVQKAKS